MRATCDWIGCGGDGCGRVDGWMVDGLMVECGLHDPEMETPRNSDSSQQRSSRGGDADRGKWMDTEMAPACRGAGSAMRWAWMSGQVEVEKGAWTCMAGRTAEAKLSQDALLDDGESATGRRSTLRCRKPWKDS
jgi:hypothetical protein